MALTGISLLVLAGLAAVGAAAATVVGWRQFGRLRIPARVVGVLLTQTLVLVTVGLAVNRSAQFYTNWDDLLTQATAGGRHHVSTPGKLDQWVRQHDHSDSAQPFAFQWRPNGWADWHLAAPPTVTVPTDYLRNPGWRYPALLVLTSAEDGWGNAAPTDLARSAQTAAGPAVLIFAHTTPATSVPTLAMTLPDQLSRDLRVTGHSWALVSSARQEPFARQMVLAAPGRYPALAVVPTGAGRGRPAGTATPQGLPVGVTVAVLGTPARTATGRPAAAPRVGSTGPSGLDALRAALLWAIRQLPAPLPESAPLVRQVRTPHGQPSPALPPHPVRPPAGTANTSA
ncbi:hypothetical protein E1258_16625 [Micromonospora sp. KC207]|uniref:hypothetical protein n=1 Tax=Micromonospora sp. KC207 TaxID=2530377 RepID=UPI00104C647D|nr:hypothetical protein [Micromonospora sp. KC207]TDC59818.1 hypothetical protein E1258_16625 [Micromonospora sp. KC207]